MLLRNRNAAPEFATALTAARRAAGRLHAATSRSRRSSRAGSSLSSR